MSIGTAIFIVGMSALALLVVGAVLMARFFRAETTRMLEQERRIKEEIEETRSSIRSGARRTGARFTS